jgi:transposase
MPPKIPVESKKMMLKVYDYFVAESKRGARFYSWKYESKPMEFHENNKTFKKDSLDHFDKDVLKNVIYGYFSKNRCVTLRKLKVELDENHGIKLTKYKLWKTLHELGFRTKKSSG